MKDERRKRIEAEGRALRLRAARADIVPEGRRTLSERSEMKWETKREYQAALRGYYISFTKALPKYYQGITELLIAKLRCSPCRTTDDEL